MINLRAISEKCLATTLEGPWGVQITLIGPNGARQTPRGQVVHDTVIKDPATGAVVKVVKSAVSLRRSSLDPIPQDGERWAFIVPLDPGEDSDTQTMFMETAPIGGRTIGFADYVLSATEQSA